VGGGSATIEEKPHYPVPIKLKIIESPLKKEVSAGGDER